ncbi:hypothetical protein QTI17_17215 [Variovorax sp. J31P179]|nr:hypothetical protein [Variovorax sp. J31P179]
MYDTLLAQIFIDQFRAFNDKRPEAQARRNAEARARHEAAVRERIERDKAQTAAVIAQHQVFRELEKDTERGNPGVAGPAPGAI